MSKFYARITQSARRTVPTARGHHGVTVWAQSFEGSVRVEMGIADGKAFYTVTLHEGSAGEFKRKLAEGYADGTPFPNSPEAKAEAIGKALDYVHAQYIEDRNRPD